METLTPAVVDASEPQTPALRVITYPTSEDAIASLRAKFEGLSAESRDGYEQIRVGISALRSTRTAIEQRRKELKADALAYGRDVDAKAKRLTELVAAIETPLQAKKDAVDEAKAKQRQAEEEARLDVLREELRLKQEADERRLAEERAKLDAERAQLDAARAEQERQDAEVRAIREQMEAKARAEREAEEAAARREREAQEAKLKAERDAIEAERRKLAEERQAAERAEAERQAAIRAEQAARERVERERREAEEARVREAERQAALKARLEALRPDVDKLLDFVETLRDLPWPEVVSAEAQEWLHDTQQVITLAADSLEARATEQGASFS